MFDPKEQSTRRLPVNIGFPKSSATHWISFIRTRTRTHMLLPR